MTNVHIQPPICTDRALELSWKDSNIRYLDHLGNSDIARKFMRQVFELPRDLLPDYERGELKVRLHSMTTPRDNRALASLCGVLNELDVHYPDTELKPGAGGDRVAIIPGVCPGL